MNACAILIGTELLSGYIVDTNSVYLAEKLLNLGIKIEKKIIVGDNINDIFNVIKNSYEKYDYIFVIGGLGPTVDDITRDAIAKYFNVNLKFDEKIYNQIKTKFMKKNTSISENNKRQVMIPENAKVIENEIGAAPAFYIKKLAAFPGVPREFHHTLLKYLKNQNLSENKIIIDDILIWNLPESEIETKILEVVKKRNDNFDIEFLVRDYGIIIRLISKNKKTINENKKIIYKKLQDYIYGENEDRIEKLLVEILLKKNITISVAESCTGGKISEYLTKCSGVSKVFTEGIISYGNNSKIARLGVKLSTLNEFGAVSSQTVNEMLLGLKTDVAIATSGISGPTGGTNEKPVGLVYIGIKYFSEIEILKCNFFGTRENISRMASLEALNLLRKKIKKLS